MCCVFLFVAFLETIGRASVLQMIKRTKFKEILQQVHANIHLHDVPIVPTCTFAQMTMPYSPGHNYAHQYMLPAITGFGFDALIGSHSDT